MKRLLSIIFTISFPVNSFAATADTITDEIIVNDPGLEKTPMILTDEELDMSPQGKTEISLFASFSSEAESNDTMGTADTIIVGSGRSGRIASSSDIDWFVFTPTTNGKFRFDLINIPKGKDYDLYLYDTNGTLLAQSRSSENNEFIVRNLNRGTNYYVKVCGYNSSYAPAYVYKIQVTNDYYAIAGWKYFFRNADSYFVGGNKYYGTPSNHKGIDVIVPYDENTNEATQNVYAYAVTSGTVMHAGEYGTAGIMVCIETNTIDPTTGNNIWIRYLHFQENSKLVSSGDTVTSSTKLALVGNTGQSDVAHLHFDVNTVEKKDGAYLNFTNTIDPELFFTSIDFPHTYTNNSNMRISNQCNDYSVIDLNHFFDFALIDYVGSDNFYNWYNSIDFEDQTIEKYKIYFNISDSDFAYILEQNNLENTYDFVA